MGWKYYSKATIGICGEHQTNLGALTSNGLIMLVFLIYKFRISHLHPFCKSQDVSEVSEVCQGGVGGSLRGVKPIFSMPIFSLHYLHRPGHLAVCLTCHGFRGEEAGGMLLDSEISLDERRLRWECTFFTINIIL